MAESKSHAVIYRGYLKEGKEEEYIENWKIIAHFFVSERGAIGSTLHRTKDGMWIAYSRWPDQKTCLTSWPRDAESVNVEFPQEIKEAIIKLKSCIDDSQSIPEIPLEVVTQVP